MRVVKAYHIQTDWGCSKVLTQSTVWTISLVNPADSAPFDASRNDLCQVPVENDTDADKHLDSGGQKGMRRLLVFLVVLGLLVVTGH
jgi:hypothetical protein